MPSPDDLLEALDLPSVMGELEATQHINRLDPSNVWETARRFERFQRTGVIAVVHAFTGGLASVESVADQLPPGPGSLSKLLALEGSLVAEELEKSFQERLDHLGILQDPDQEEVVNLGSAPSGWCPKCRTERQTAYGNCGICLTKTTKGPRFKCDGCHRLFYIEDEAYDKLVVEGILDQPKCPHCRKDTVCREILPADLDGASLVKTPGMNEVEAAAPQAQDAQQRMVQCDSCNKTHVYADTIKMDGQAGDLHFCSPECCEEYFGTGGE